MKRINLRKIFVVGMLLLWVFAITACGNVGIGQASNIPPTPTLLPTPIIPEKPTYTVQLGTVVRTLEFTGRASPTLEQELFFRADGFVGDVLVERNAWVQAGDVLAELEIGSLEFQLAQQQLALQTAESNLAQAEQDRADNLVDAQIALEQLTIQMERAQSEDINAPVTIAQIGLDQAILDLEDAQAHYRDVMDGARDWEPYIADTRETAAKALKNAQDNLTIAQINTEQTIFGRNSKVYDLQVMTLNLRSAQLAIERLERDIDPQMTLAISQVQAQIGELERQIADARLIAPFDGQILSIGIDPGDYASAFSTVIVLADPTELEMTAELGAEELSDMALGQEALITLRNRPDETLNGEVRQLPYPYGGGTADAGDDDPAVHIAIEGDVELAPGELATVSIVLEEKENVLWLPPAAIRTFQGRDFVVVQLDEGQRRVDVLLGIETEERVEIVQGLEEGQIIVGE
jgi:multidrug efflux pump subunit AcrA (membrane-fusion protein)